MKEETTALQEKMVQELGLDPIDKEVAIVYQGEKQHYSDEFFKVFSNIHASYYEKSLVTHFLTTEGQENC